MRKILGNITRFWEDQLDVPKFNFLDLVEALFLDAGAVYGIVTNLLWISCGCPTTSRDSDCNYSRLEIAGLEVVSIVAIALLYVVLRTQRYKKIKEIHEITQQQEENLTEHQHSVRAKVDENEEYSCIEVLDEKEEKENKSEDQEERLMFPKETSTSDHIPILNTVWDFLDEALSRFSFTVYGLSLSMMSSARMDTITSVYRASCSEHFSPNLIFVLLTGLVAFSFAPNTATKKIEQLIRKSKHLALLSRKRTNNHDSSNGKQVSYGSCQNTRS